MSEKIKVSAGIVTYHNYEEVRGAVKSLLEYTKGVELTVYVADNASGDDTLQKLKEEFPQVITLQNEKNNGFGYGHNKILPLLETKYHAIVNPDILLDRDAITELVEYMEQNPDIGQITPQIRFPSGEDQQLPKRNPVYAALVGRHIFKEKLRPVVEHYQMLDEDLSKPIDIEFATGCFSVIRTELYKEIGGFDERFFLYFEDMDLTRRVCQKARAVYYPLTYVFHAWERSSSHSIKYFLILIWSSFKYFGKWGFVWK